MQGYQAPPLSRVNKVIVIALVATFVLGSFAQKVLGFPLQGLLGLIPTEVLGLRAYTLVTYPWYESELMSVLFNGLAIWFLGSELEVNWGERVYIKFLATCVVLTGVSFSLLGMVFGLGGLLVGSAGLTYALCVAYAVLYPDRRFLLMFAFPVKALWFCLIMAGIELYMGFFSGNPAAWGHLISMGLAFLMIRYQNWGPVAWWLRGPSKKPRSASHLRLVKEEREKPKYWH